MISMKLYMFFIVILFFTLIFLIPFSSINFSIKKRIDCCPGKIKTKKFCFENKCLWDDRDLPENIPKCYFPQNTGYVVDKILDETNQKIRLRRSKFGAKNPFGNDFEYLIFEWKNIGDGIYVKISPESVTRYRPPIPINDEPIIKSSEQLIVQTMNDSIFSFFISRSSDDENLFDTAFGGLLFSDQYIQLSGMLSTNQIFGFGEHIRKTLMHDLSEYKTWGMNARDAGTDAVSDIPYNYYGPGPHVTYRTIGGQLELFFFPGPTPEAVIQQYQQVIGRPYLPPYWGLDYQLCRWGYNGTEEILEIVNEIREAGIPQDGQCADIDYMEEAKTFTYNKSPEWKNLPNLIDDLHEKYEIHFILIFDPGMEVNSESFNRAIESGASFVEWPRMDLVPKCIQSQYPLINHTKIMLGKVWPEDRSAFPDFLDPLNLTNEWWENEIVNFHKELKFDGACLDMNEPSNFDTLPEGEENGAIYCPYSGPDSYFDHPPYETVSVFNRNDYLFTKTLCMFGTTMRNKTTFYNTKNLYGWSHTRATMAGMEKARKKRSLVISRSTFPSSGKYGGHWLGDNLSKRSDMKATVIGIQDFNLFGIPFVGSDICGFWENPTEELCLRWHQLGAFYPFSRNHNSREPNPQHPTRWSTVAAATKQANLFRYLHLPYLYSLFFKVSRFGGTVIRPVFFEFPEDPITVSLSFQFMWGNAMMIIPVLEPNVSSIFGYLPESVTWYSLQNFDYGNAVSSGNISRPASIFDLLPIFVRSGTIIPRQKPGLTTLESRNNPFELLIVLPRKYPAHAYGELYWDNGESFFDKIENHNFHHFIFSAIVGRNKTMIKIKKIKSAIEISMPKLENIEIFGFEFQPNFQMAELNGEKINIEKIELLSNKVLRITKKDMIDFNLDNLWILTWQNK